VEPVLEPIVESQRNPFRSKGRVKTITWKPKGRGNNPRIKTRDDIKDEEMKSEIIPGSVLVSYSTTDTF